MYIRQAQALGLGHAVLCARPIIGNDPFAVLLADDFMQGEPGGKGVMAQMTAEFERQQASLLAVLNGNAAPADKALACKQLAVHGSEASASALAKLLSDPQLASWARIALEAIPGSAIDEALRRAEPAFAQHAAEWKA